MITRISKIELAKLLVEYCGSDTLIRYSNHPKIGIEPAAQTGNNWVNAIFFTTLRHFTPDIKKIFDYIDNIKHKYLIVASINSNKILDRKYHSDKEFSEIASATMAMGSKIASNESLNRKEALRQAFLRSGIEVLIGGHDKYEVTVFDDDAVSVSHIYELI